MASASNVAKKLLSRLHLRDNKSSTPEENSEASVENEQCASASPPPIDDNEDESDPVISKRARKDNETLNVAHDLSTSRSDADRTSSRDDHKQSDTLEVGRKSGTTLGVSAKPLQSDRRPRERVDRSKKPTVKPRVQSPPSPHNHHLPNGEERIKAENGSAHKPAATISGHTTPQENVPGPVKPLRMRKTAPSSSRPPKPAPRPLSSPNIGEGSTSTSLTPPAASLTGLSGGSTQELQLLSELQQKAAANDYYGLLGVDPEATLEELSRARREKTRVLHPDHFVNDPERQAK